MASRMASSTAGGIGGNAEVFRGERAANLLGGHKVHRPLPMELRTLGLAPRARDGDAVHDVVDAICGWAAHLMHHGEPGKPYRRLSAHPAGDRRRIECGHGAK